MSQVNENDLVCVAAVSGAFGVTGEVKIKPFTETPSGCVSYGPLQDSDGRIVLTPLSHRVMKDFIALRAEEVKTREDAEALKPTKLYIAREALPEPEEDDFYYSDLVGMEVKSTDGKRVGTVIAVHEFGAGDMLEIEPFLDKKTKKRAGSFFHPFTKLATPKVDMKQGRLIIVPQIAAEGPPKEVS
jgi:16S rRNA processing protein RimM